LNATVAGKKDALVNKCADGMGTVTVHYASAGFAAKFLFLSVMPSAGEMFRGRRLAGTFQLQAAGL
jgi:hypothetical protein